MKDQGSVSLFSGLISSKTRIKLLIRFFFNPATRSYLRELSKEFNLSTNAVREELNQLTKTNLLKSEKNGRNVYYTANQEHPLFPELKSMVGKVMGMDQVIDGIVNGTGWLARITSAFSGKFDNVVVDGIVNATAYVSGFFGLVLRKFQTGKVQTYVVLTVVSVMILYFVYRLV